MAHGHDAADTSLMTTFGVYQLASFTVWTDEGSEGGAQTTMVITPGQRPISWKEDAI
jgi:hypothetical protein